MRPFRRPEQALAVVRARAARRRRQRSVIAAAIALGAVAIVLVGLALRSDGDADPDEVTGPAEPTGVAPSIERLDAGDTGLPDGFRPSAIASGPAGFVLVSDEAAGEQNRAAPVWRSTDGREWEAAAPEVFSTQTVRALAGSPQGFVVAVTGPDGLSQLYVSTDGGSWGPALQLEGDDDGSSLRAAGDRFYRSAGGQLLVSTDGPTWTPTTAGTAPLPPDVALTYSGTDYLAVRLDGDAIGAMWRSTDGTTFDSIATPAIPGVAGVAGGSSRAVIGYRGPGEGEGCEVTTAVSATCTWPMSFAVFDPASGATSAPAQATFETADPDAHLAAWPGGWLALARTGDEVAVWSSVDGQAWAPADEALAVAEGGPTEVVGGPADGPAGAVVAGGERGEPPAVALLTPG